MELLCSGAAFRSPYRDHCSEGLHDVDILWNLIDRLKDKKAIADNITKQARYAKALFIWTDCDREGEHIGSEVRQAALEGNSRLQVKRARFSNTERA